MKSGPSATFGIMLRLTISGITACSTIRDHDDNSATPTPNTTATA